MNVITYFQTVLQGYIAFFYENFVGENHLFKKGYP